MVYKGVTKQHLSTEQAQAVIDSFVSGMETKEIAVRFNISESNICCIIQGKSWPSLSRPKNLVDVLRRRGCYSKFARKDLPEITSHQMNLIIGSLLGDGNLTNKGNNCNSEFRKLQKHKEHVLWLTKELSPYGRDSIYETKSYLKPKKVNGKLTHVKTQELNSYYYMRTIAHTFFTDLRHKWYPLGQKIVPTDLILNEEILSIWYVDDGCNDLKNRTCSLATQSFTNEEVEFLCYRLNKDLNLIGKVYGNDKPRITFMGCNYDGFISIVKDYVIWDCFAYKIKHRQSKKVI